ncbi:hypothetical protein OJ997_27860 [Solirubrobacter phytolaccae]|uniref:Mannosylglycerate hydrolase MGH1-like glycoside hydrolase domain-containing protein n=1 Tax=Solirubrobacter phytolaccae TaxID=1404360 RepID=A0A9X3SIC6_9ACTN|nr:hypothetical protein [Solirubrobacter phytolaccae]MDA0184157.1 hypothetical protein [Solirubrobacter phytolaccae]
MTPEHVRLEEARSGTAAWKAWGPYLSERQWGTVREDDSASGDAWNAFTHDEARSKAYRWGEDGLAGVSDDKQRLCLALALWNGHDPILKERIFGLTNSEGNHGEDAKEYWFYLDSTPTHSYMKWAYKYPQAAFPYEQLVHHGRGRDDLELELLDTGVFDSGRYFDVVVEYAKGGPEDLLMLITVHNRGPEAATLHVLPTLWLRNTWHDGSTRPSLHLDDEVVAGDFRFSADGDYLFCENESDGPYPKVTINDHVLHGAPTNPDATGTKCAAHSVLEVPAGESVTVRARLSTAPLGGFDAVLATRREEADAFYAAVLPESLGEDRARIMRQSLAGMLWTKQFYAYDVHRWLRERGINPWSAEAAGQRNGTWFHMVASDIISMPDKWEYPWFAAWDLAFHCAPLALVDLDFAKEQVELLLHTRYVHPNGQIPAYEWNFSDVNPPVTAWAALWVYHREQETRGAGDRVWLGRVFQRLLTNFTWWVNRKDPDGRNLFQGGFLGLDNIGIFDRSKELPGGGTLQQADGTAWMALYCQWMLQIAVELGREDQSYADIALKFVAHFAWIAIALNPPDADTPLWDEADGFFYDVMRMPDGTTIPLRVRSLVGLLPLCAATVFEPEDLAGQPGLVERALEFAERFKDSVPALAHVPREGHEGRRMLSLVDHHQLRQLLTVMLDEDEFLSPHGIRSLSRRHADEPCEFDWAGEHYEVRYQPAESDSGMFGGNSNWRGPVWFPMNLVILRALFQMHRYYGEDFKVECPTGSGTQMSLQEVALEISRRLISTFERGEDGKRPVYGSLEAFQDDPHWRDLLLFYEYFHGDNGAGLGASHQTGWTGTVATLLWLVSQ